MYKTIAFFLVVLPCFFLAGANDTAKSGRIDFESTELTGRDAKKIVEMGKLRVPENRSRPGSRMIELAVVRLKSDSPNSGPPIVYLPGGPGGSAINEMWLPWMESLFQVLRKNNDIILMDQRGIGRSTPNFLWNSSVSLPPDVFLSQEKMEANYRQLSLQAAEWFKKEGFDFAGYNSVESADDLNDLRIGLGVKKISLLGFSYGTHLGLATIRRHSPHLDSVVLIGTEGPNHSVKLPSTYDIQLQKLSQLASQDPDIRAKVPDMLALLKKVLTRLEKEPVTVTVQNQATKQPVNVPVGKFGLQLIVRMDVGDRNDFPEFPALFYTIDKGDSSLLTKYVEKRYNQFGRRVSGMYILMELSSGATAERLAQIRKETPKAILGEVVNFPNQDASIWGNPDLGDDYRSPIVSSTRTLFISGTLDSNTPPYQAEEVRWGFSNATHIIVEYAGHEDALPNEAVRAAIVDFFNGKDVSGVRLSLGPPKFKPIP
ncbi:alpha/beta hydrolase [bacterium]|nr:alpha/beta hydrolase [bacterium]MCI0603468.1 alpha/beta hydrolase [bacterium]